MALVRSHTGWRNWVIQRISSLIIGFFSIFLIFYTIAHPAINFSQWQMLYQHSIMKIFTLVTMLAIIWHAWLGIWTVLTDYVKQKQIRYVLEFLTLVLLWGSFAWVIVILWA